jgi:pilus assembly protein Flp/PilA
LLTALLDDKAGQAMVEYGLILAVIALAVFGALALMGSGLADFFRNLANMSPIRPTEPSS